MHYASGALLEAAEGRDTVVQVVALVPFVYLSMCAFFGLFRIRLSKFYSMNGRQRTDEQSMLWNASYLMRLIAPLGFNFVTLLRAEGTAFQEILGRMDVVPFLGSGFNNVVPILVAVFCLATLLNLYGRILKLLGVTRFEHSSDYDDEHVDEGRGILRKEKRRRGLNPDGALLD